MERMAKQRAASSSEANLSPAASPVGPLPSPKSSEEEDEPRPLHLHSEPVLHSSRDEGDFTGALERVHSVPELRRPIHFRRGGLIHQIKRPPWSKSGDESPQSHLTKHEGHTTSNFLLKMLSATGVVFGDIGTSPLYTYSGIFIETLHDTKPDPKDVVETFSMIFWTVTIVVGIKYVLTVMRVSHHGEGGTFAMMQSILHDRQSGLGQTTRNVVVGLTMLGVAFLTGDGCITPAISVMSALEGIPVEVSESTKVGLSVVILFFIFCAQSRGSKVIGLVAGPVTTLWFLSIGALGVYNLLARPQAALQVIAGLSPTNIISFWRKGVTAWRSLAGVVLAVTGAEALYADMGHFGAMPISVAWFVLVYPSLILQYMGQAAALIEKSEGIATPFYNTVPKELAWPAVILATIATVVASQAMISGLFSIMSQAHALSFIPRIKVMHTNADERGQVYVPEANWALCVMCIAICVSFRSSAKLAGAYGIAVTSTFLITTTLLFFVLHHVWKWNIILSLMVVLPLFVLDFLLWSANLLKIMDSGWVPVVISVVTIIIMHTFRWGRLREEKIMADEGAVIDQELRNNSKEPGMASNLSRLCTVSALQRAMQKTALVRGDRAVVFMTPSQHRVPRTVGALASLLGYLPKVIVLLSLKFEEVPFVSEQNRASFKHLGHSIFCVVLHYGYAEPLSAETFSLRRSIRAVARPWREVYPDLKLLGDLEENPIRGSGSQAAAMEEGRSGSGASKPSLAAEGHRATFVLHKLHYAVRPETKNSLLDRVRIPLYSFIVLNSRKALSFFGLESVDAMEIGVVRFL